MSTPSRACLVSLFALTAACGGASSEATQTAENARAASGAEQAQAEPSQETKPRSPGLSPEVKAQLERELEPLELYAAATPDGAVETRVESLAAPEVTVQEGVAIVVATLDEAQGFLRCFIYGERLDPGHLISNMVDESLGSLEGSQFQSVRTGQVAGWPYATMRALYRVKTEQGVSLGDLKLGVSARGETTVLCSLDAPGYDQSFTRLLRGVLENLDVQGAEAPFAERTVYAMRLGERLAGFTEVIVREAEGLQVNTRLEANYMIGPDGSLVAHDHASVRTSREGGLVGGLFYKATGGQPDYELELEAADMGYAVKGTVQGKEFVATVEASEPVPSLAVVEELACKVHRGEVGEADYAAYEPAANPAGLLVSRVVATDDPFDVRTTMGEDFEVLEELDDVSCDTVRARIPLGGATMEIERVWHEAP